MSFVVTLLRLMSKLLTLSLSLPRFLALISKREESSASRGLPTCGPPGEVRERKRKRKRKITGEIGQSGAFEEKKEERLDPAP